MADKGKRRGRAERYEEPEELPIYEPATVDEEARLPEAPAEMAVEQEERRYFVDPQWYERQGLAFNMVAQARLCASCTAKLGTFVEERYPVIDPKTKRVSFELRKVPYAANPLPVIRDHCSRAKDFITPETPLMEAMFRVFLANGNQPIPLSTVRDHLLTYLPDMAALRSDFPLSMLERLIKGDNMYGIVEHEVPVGV